MQMWRFAGRTGYNAAACIPVPSTRLGFYVRSQFGAKWPKMLNKGRAGSRINVGWLGNVVAISFLEAFGLARWASLGRKIIIADPFAIVCWNAIGNGAEWGFRCVGALIALGSVFVTTPFVFGLVRRWFLGHS